MVSLGSYRTHTCLIAVLAQSKVGLERVVNRKLALGTLIVRHNINRSQRSLSNATQTLPEVVGPSLRVWLYEGLAGLRYHPWRKR